MQTRADKPSLGVELCCSNNTAKGPVLNSDGALCREMERKEKKKESETADIFTFQSLRAALLGFSEKNRNVSTTVSTLKKEEEIARGDISFHMVSQLQKIKIKDVGISGKVAEKFQMTKCPAFCTKLGDAKICEHQNSSELQKTCSLPRLRIRNCVSM